MAPSNSDLIDPITRWLQDGAYALELWLASGVSTPAPAAQAALRHWCAAAEEAGFHPVTERAQPLLDPGTSSPDRADALLDLMVWHLSLERAHTAQQSFF